MKKRNLVLLLVALLLTGALAQDEGPTIDTRLSILENRVTRLESDLSRLSGVPTQLARIEEKITALTDRTDGQGSILQTVGLGIIMTTIGSLISYQAGKKSKS